ncbi:uncharacterized protein LOC121422505 [Lytechinus variegatus]|uniref:uncharacterized protein LOC121422505 n=1 Tax=Lytechinus variegatus TaxID=7654 RepID=UPI001BB1EE66|nr:uncharacterized protein LOC121422505 [Lytechinus variegatus]
MHQTLAILLVLTLVGATLAMNPRQDFADRRGMQRMEKMKPMRQGMQVRNEYLERFQADAEKRARKYGESNLREKMSKLKTPYADQLSQLRERMAAGQERFGAKMMRGDRRKVKRSSRRQP